MDPTLKSTAHPGTPIVNTPATKYAANIPDVPEPAPLVPGQLVAGDHVSLIAPDPQLGTSLTDVDNAFGAKLQAAGGADHLGSPRLGTDGTVR